MYHMPAGLCACCDGMSTIAGGAHTGMQVYSLALGDVVSRTSPGLLQMLWVLQNFPATHKMRSAQVKHSFCHVCAESDMLP